MTNWEEQLQATSPAAASRVIPDNVDWEKSLGSGGVAQSATPQADQMIYDPDNKNVAGGWDVGVASLASDPQAKLRYYAQELGIPEESMQVHNGNIFAKGKDGKFFNVEAGNMNQLMKGVGPSFPAVGGGIGTVLGMAGGPLTAAAGGVGGASGGQYLRELAAQQLMGQTPSAYRVAKEGAIDLVSTVAGLLVGKGLTRAAATKAGKELETLMKQGGMAAMDALEETLKQVNSAYGTNIRLTAAELSNSTKLRAQQMAVDNHPQEAQRMSDYYKDRAGESDKAFSGMLDKEFGPGVSPDVAGGRLVGSAVEAEKELTRQVSREGSPLYKTAFKESEELGGINIRPVTDLMAETERAFPSAAAGIKQVRDMVMKVTQRDTPGGPVDHVKYESNLELLQDGVKETLDDLISQATQQGSRKLAGRYRKIQDKLLSTIDAKVPSFKVARETWAELMAAKGLAEGGMIPTLAGKKLKDFEEMGRLFFNGTSPSEIARVRSAILKTEGGEANWNAVLRGYLDQQWAKAGRVYKSQVSDPTKAGVIQPLTYWADMIGDTKQMARLQKAMNTTQFTAFKNLMDVFEATGRATNFNSSTVRQQAGRDMLEGATLGGEVAKTIVNPNPITLLSRAQEGIQNLINEGNVSRIVDVLTNGDSIKELLKISSRSTGRDKAAMAVMKAFNLARTQAETHLGGTLGEDAYNTELGN
mgnify:FL=1